MAAIVKELLLLVTILVSLCSLVHSQGSCERMTVDLLEDGLVGNLLDSAGGDGTVIPPVQVNNMKIVCEAQDIMQNRYRYTSVVVSFTCSGQTPPYCDNSMILTQQFDFGCSSTNMWTSNIFNSDVSTSRTLFPAATLATEKASDCRVCINPIHPTVAALNSMSSETTHCIKCSNCTDGLQRCHSSIGAICCSYFYENMCETVCPNALVGDQNFMCGCTELSDANGDFVFTNGMSVGSIATLSCQTGFDLSGSSPITCQESGWTGMPTCEPICSQLIADCIACTLDQQNQVVCSNCSTGLVFINGACTEAAPPSSCDTGCIIGLAVGILLGIILIFILVIVFVALINYVICSKKNDGVKPV